MADSIGRLEQCWRLLDFKEVCPALYVQGSRGGISRCLMEVKEVSVWLELGPRSLCFKERDKMGVSVSGVY